MEIIFKWMKIHHTTIETHVTPGHTLNPSFVYSHLFSIIHPVHLRFTLAGKTSINFMKKQGFQKSESMPTGHIIFLPILKFNKRIY